MIYITTNSSSLTVKDSMSVAMMMGVVIIMSKKMMYSTKNKLISKQEPRTHNYAIIIIGILLEHNSYCSYLHILYQHYYVYRYLIITVSCAYKSIIVIMCTRADVHVHEL